MDKADPDGNTPARITRAPAPVRAISGGFVREKPATPPLDFLTPPPDFVVFAHIPSVLALNADRWGIPPGRVPTAADLRAYARAITPPLALEETQAAGIDSNTGALMWVPTSTWRTSGILKGQLEGAALLALNGQAIRCSVRLRNETLVYPILPCRALALMFGAKIPPDPPPRSVLARIQDAGMPAARQAMLTYRTGLPGRDTSWHLVEHELQQRCSAGVVEATCTAEARKLAAWLLRTHPYAAKITGKTIYNRLMAEHSAIWRPRQTPETK